MILDRDRSQLVIVDVQERLVPVMYEGDRMIDKCALLMQGATELGVPVIISEQYRKGLGPTVPQLDALKGEAVVREKIHFSCSEDPDILADASNLANAGRRQMVVAGIEAHVCVLQSALGFKKAGFDVYVAMDATTSRLQSSVDLARDRLLANRVTPVNAEMVLFEWLNVSGTPEFKAISKLAK
ncbi:MAG: isochorismatase family protein [Rhodospirillaceae bacterium]|nr:isochorismatase family protein [Rhodospirillaceae bacterium]